MKFSLANKIRVIIVSLFLLTLLLGIIIIAQLNSGVNLDQKMEIAKNNENRIVFLSTNELLQLVNIRNNIETTIYIVFILQFILSLVLIFNLPNFLKQSLKEVQNILSEINKGNYTIEIEPDIFHKRMDKEFLNLIISIKNVLMTFKKFDELKKEKIIEYKNRLINVLNISDNGFMIFQLNGELLYINETVLETFPSLNIESSIFESNFIPDLENSIKKYVIQTLKNKSKTEDAQYFMPSLKRHVKIKSAIVKNSTGFPIGAVFCFPDISKKKEKKDKESENE